MALHRPRPIGPADRMDLPTEEWPFLDQEVLVQARSHKVCMTCHWFQHQAGVNCIPLLSCQLHQGLIAHGEHLTSRWPAASIHQTSCVRQAAVMGS